MSLARPPHPDERDARLASIAALIIEFRNLAKEAGGGDEVKPEDVVTWINFTIVEAPQELEIGGMVSVAEVERVMKLFTITGLWSRIGSEKEEKPVAAANPKIRD